MNHIGTQEIRTERLLLRKVKESDYKDIYNYASKEEVAKYVTWPPHKSIKDSKALCKMWAEEYKKDDTYRWAVVFNHTVIGTIDVMAFIENSAELGWAIDSMHWNKGIMTEAASAVRDYLFEKVGVDSIFARYITENIGSGRVMQKIGMKPITCEAYYKALNCEIRREVKGMPIAFNRITKTDWENKI